MNETKYNDISSLCKVLGVSAKALYTASNTIDAHYRTVRIPKGNGEYRTLHVPDDFLKNIQRQIAAKLFTNEELPQCATAYIINKGILANAMPHVGREIVVKMDIRKFFDHITYPMVKERVFAADKYSESLRILLSILCVYRHAVPQGAPTSPMISNMVLREFDIEVNEWCTSRDITYTRYCDDMTFSGDFNPDELIPYVKDKLLEQGFFINPRKTVILKNGQRKSVTGITVNEKVSVCRKYKKQLRQELYYCQKYGLKEHIKTIAKNENYGSVLLGRINYVLSVEKYNDEIKGYRQWLINQMKV